MFQSLTHSDALNILYSDFNCTAVWSGAFSFVVFVVAAEMIFETRITFDSVNVAIFLSQTVRTILSLVMLEEACV